MNALLSRWRNIDELNARWQSFPWYQLVTYQWARRRSWKFISTSPTFLWESLKSLISRQLIAQCKSALLCRWKNIDELDAGWESFHEYKLASYQWASPRYWHSRFHFNHIFIWISEFTCLAAADCTVNECPIVLLKKYWWIEYKMAILSLVSIWVAIYRWAWLLRYTRCTKKLSKCVFYYLTSYSKSNKT